ncbi:hypothetical protein [Actinoplanes sp. NPDC023714]|uniref:hypothetical protein n=1 Tax=Actinoplanes sp. NPDC023714 TaxID=3154322 RepID=UPI0033CC38FC
MTSPFPGPWLAGLSLITGPLLLLAGTLLRLGVPFFFPHQLAAFQRQPTLMGTASALWLAGLVALWPGVIAVAGRVAETRPGWGRWGGALVLTGLFARAVQHGAGTFAVSLAGSAGVDEATRAVGAFYTRAEWVTSSLTAAIMLGWVVLAAGCYLSGVLRLLPAVALALMSGLMIGVLKGSTWASAVQVTGLVVSLVPLGLVLLRDARRPSWRTLIAAGLFVVASIVLGRLG